MRPRFGRGGQGRGVGVPSGTARRGAAQLGDRSGKEPLVDLWDGEQRHADEDGDEHEHSERDNRRRIHCSTTIAKAVAFPGVTIARHQATAAGDRGKIEFSQQAAHLSGCSAFRKHGSAIPPSPNVLFVNSKLGTLPSNP